MTKKFRPYDQKQSLIIPPDLRDWLPDDHLAIFVSDTVDELDLAEIYDYYDEARGAPPYAPEMLVKVILYAYCIGRASSRKIGNALVDDIAFRYLGAGNFPDFRTISDFRRRHLKALSKLFVQVLKMCREVGLVKLGAVSLDGMKVKANASLDNNRDYEALCKEEDELEKLIEKALKKAIEIDDEEDKKYGKDKRGDELPEGLRNRKERKKRIRKAREELERRQKELRDKYEDRMEERARTEEKTGKGIRGRKPKEVPKKPDNDKKRNTTDPESRIMKGRHGYVQGYNAQIVVDVESQVIVAHDVVQDENDYHQLVSMLKLIEENLGRLPDALMADAGYWCEDEIRKVLDLLDLYIATTKDWKQRKALREKPPPRGRIPKDMSLRDRMERKLLTRHGRQMYKKRGKTVEPVNGQIKEGRGFRRFLLRGVEKVKGEFALITTTGNILKLWRHANKAANG